MKVCHILICFFFLTLQDGNIGLINAEIPIFTRTEGQDITVPCTFTKKGNWKYFCKGECKEKFLEMNNASAQSGRYSMKYEKTRTGSRLNVTITKLTKSDSGHYGCGLDKFLSQDPYKKFEIIVKDAPSTSKPNLTLRPSLTSVQSASTPPPPTTTQSFRRSSTPSSSSAETINQSEEQQTTTAASSVVPLYVGLTLLITALLFFVALLIFCKKRATKPKEHPVETEYANVTEASRVYEEIREDGRQSRSPPVEISSNYAVKFTKPNGVDTAAASCPLNKTENSSELVYSQVDFSNVAAASLSSAPRGHGDDVVYSTPRKHTEVGTDAKDVSQLYSAVGLPQ